MMVNYIVKAVNNSQKLKKNSSLSRDISEFSTKSVIDTLEVIFQMHESIFHLYYSFHNVLFKL